MHIWLPLRQNVHKRGLVPEGSFWGVILLTRRKVVFLATLSDKLFFAPFTFVAAKNSTWLVKSSAKLQKWPQKTGVLPQKQAFSTKTKENSKNTHETQRMGKCPKNQEFPVFPSTGGQFLGGNPVNPAKSDVFGNFERQTFFLHQLLSWRPKIAHE